MKANWTFRTVAGVVLSVAVSAGAQTGGTPLPASGSEYAAQAGDLYAQEAATVPAELAKTLDSRNARVDQEVVAKTVRETRLTDGSTLEKGAKLFGHVTDVQANSPDSPNGRVAVLFDHAMAKDGHQVPIHALMVAIREPPHSAPPTMGSSDGMGAPGMGGPGMAGPGPLGAPGAGTRTGEPGSMDEPRTGPVNMPPGSPGLGSGPVAGPSGSVGGLPGVTWSNVTASGKPADAASGAATAVMFLGQGRDVKLAGGTQMVLAVTPQQTTPQQ